MSSQSDGMIFTSNIEIFRDLKITLELLLYFLLYITNIFIIYITSIF